MLNKSEQIARLLKSGQDKKALSLAAKFFDRSGETKIYQQAVSAINNQGFYKQIGKDPVAMHASAISLLRERFVRGGAKDIA